MNILFGVGLTGFLICLMIMYITPYGIKGICAYDSNFKLFDMQFRYNSQKLYHTFENITEAGRLAYLHYLLLDFCFIACFLVVMWCVSVRVAESALYCNILIGLASIRAVLDIAENTILIILLKRFPEQNKMLADICSWTTTFKFVAMFLWIGLVVITLTGCSGKQDLPEPLAQEITASYESEENLPVKESYMVAGDNYIDYQPGLECAAFSSAYLLRHYGEAADGLVLYENFPSKLPEGGVMPNGIKEFFISRGYEAEFKDNGTVADLKELLNRGVPVIVFIHVEEPYETTHNTHYIPLIGYDAEYFYFAESLTDYANCKEEKDVPYNRKTEIAKFERLWANIDGTWDYPYFVIAKK